MNGDGRPQVNLDELSAIREVLEHSRMGSIRAHEEIEAMLEELRSLKHSVPKKAS